MSEVMKGTFARVTKTGYVFTIGKVPILDFDKEGERISYFSETIFNPDQCDRPPIEHIHLENVEAVIRSRGSQHEFSVIGTDPAAIVDLIQKIEHILGAKDITVSPTKLYLPLIKKFRDRLRYFSRWIFLGKTEEN